MAAILQARDPEKSSDSKLPSPNAARMGQSGSLVCFAPTLAVRTPSTGPLKRKSVEVSDRRAYNGPAVRIIKERTKPAHRERERDRNSHTALNYTVTASSTNDVDPSQRARATSAIWTDTRTKGQLKQIVKTERNDHPSLRMVHPR